VTPQDTFYAQHLSLFELRLSLFDRNVVPAPTKDVDSSKAMVTLKDKELDFICARSWLKIRECFHIESAQFDL